MSEKNRAALWMLGLLALSYALVSADRRVFDVLANSIRYDLGLSETQAMLASDATLLALGVSSLGVGYLTRVFNRKVVALAGLLLASLATLAVANAQDFTELFIARLIVGLGTSLLFSAVLTIGIRYFARQRFTVVALVFFATGLGTVVGINLGGIFDEELGWRGLLIAFGMLGLPMTVMLILCVKPWFAQTRVLIPLDSISPQFAPEQSMWSRQPMLLGGMTILLGISIFSFRNVYVSHLREVGGFTWKTGQVTPSLYAFGFFFAFYGASLFKRHGARTVLMSSFLLAGMLTFIMLLGVWHNAVAYVLNSLLLGIILAGVVTVNLMSEMIRSVVAEEAPLVMGWFAACLFGPVILLNPLTLILQESLGWRGAGMVLITGSAVVASLLAMFLPRSSKISHNN